MDNKIKKFTKFVLVFAAVFAVCTFFSKSLYNYRIPTVTVAFPIQGILDLTVEGDTEIGYSGVRDVYCEVDGKVRRILIEAGEEVSAGQTVMQFEAYGTGEMMDITAEKAGIITGIGVNEGMYVSSMQNTVLYRYAEKSSEWTACLLIGDEQRDLVTLDSIPVFQVEGMEGAVPGRMLAITACTDQWNSGWQIQMSFQSKEGGLGGRKAKVTIDSEQQMYDTLIPVSALRRDSEGYFCLVLRQNESVLGRGFVAYRMSVELLDSDREYCAVRGLPSDEQVIISATDVIGNGSNVYYGGVSAE